MCFYIEREERTLSGFGQAKSQSISVSYVALSVQDLQLLKFASSSPPEERRKGSGIQNSKNQSIWHFCGVRMMSKIRDNVLYQWPERNLNWIECE